MRPAHAQQNSHRSNATFDGMEDQSLTLEQTFPRNTSKSTFEKGSSFYSQNGGQLRRHSSASRFSSSNSTSYPRGGGAGGQRSYKFDHSLSYTSHNELDIVGEEFDVPPQPSSYSPKPAMYTTPSGSQFMIDDDGQAIPTGTERYLPRGEPPLFQGFRRNDAIMEEPPFHNQQQPQQPHQRRNPAAEHPKSPNGNQQQHQQQQTNKQNTMFFVPPLEKMEPQHVDVSAPSRRCLQQPAPPILVVGTIAENHHHTTTKLLLGHVAVRCHSCRTQLYAPKAAVVVRCPHCRAVTSEAVCLHLQ